MFPPPIRSVWPAGERAETRRIRVVFRDPQVGFVIEQSVQHISGIAHRGVDDLGMKGRVLIRNVRIKEHAGVVAVPRVHPRHSFGLATSTETLSVRVQRGAITPRRRERVFILGIDEFCQGRRVGFIADMPRLQPEQLRVGRSGAGFRHFDQSEIDGVSQNRGKEQSPAAWVVVTDSQGGLRKW